MPFGMEVGLGPAHIMLDAAQLLHPKGGGVACLPLFDHVYCGQTAGWIMMPLGTEVGLDQGHIVLDGDPASSRRGAQQHLTFRYAYVYIVAKRLLISVAEMGDRGHNRHGPKRGGGAGSPQCGHGSRSTSIRSGVFIHLAVWPQ